MMNAYGQFTLLPLAIGGVLMELLLGALILRSAVSWRNRVSASRLVVPDLGRAIGIMGVSLLVWGAIVLGFAGLVGTTSGLVVSSSGSAVDRVFFYMVFLFAPFLLVSFYLARSWVFSSMLRTSFEDGMIIQLLELPYYFGAGIVLGLIAVLIVAAGN